MLNKNIQWWKIALLVLGVMMIAAAVTYTLVLRASAATASEASNFSKTATTANVATSDGEGELNWVKNLSTKFESSDYIIVIFAGSDDLTAKADQMVKIASEKIRQDGTNIEAMTLSSTDSEFQTTLDRLAIQKLPAIRIVAPTGQGETIKGDITETKILQAYLSLQKACVPGASGCCPK
jgi:hypothetical protein